MAKFVLGSGKAWEGKKTKKKKVELIPAKVCIEWGLNPRSNILADLKSAPLDHSGINAFHDSSNR